MGIVIEQVALLMLFIATGYLLCKTKLVDSRNAGLLSRLEMNLFIPATVFNTFASNFSPSYLQEKYPLVLVSALVLVAIALLSRPISGLLTKNSYQKNVYSYSLTIPNYGFVGYALADGIFGSEMLLNVMMVALPVSIYAYTIGYCTLTKTKLSLKKLFNPIIIALVLGVITGLSGFQLPGVASTFLTKAAACMSPVSMVLTGMVISDYSLPKLLKNKSVYILTAARLLIIPCTVALILKLVGLNDMVLPMLMVTAMPCGMYTIVFPKSLGEDCETGASLVFITSILCCVTIPLCLFFFGGTV